MRNFIGGQLQASVWSFLSFMCVVILGTHLGLGPRLELAQPKKITNRMFQSKAAILKSPLVCHCWMQRAAQLSAPHLLL